MRRILAALVTGTLLLGLPGGALAFPSGSKPTQGDDTTIEWTGQGASNGTVGTPVCGTVNGAETDGTYLLWILETDHWTLSGSPTLALTFGGSPVGSYPGTLHGISWHFLTPYLTPSTTDLSAVASFVVGSVGGGVWTLTISHGCAPSDPPPAAGLTVVDDDFGLYDIAYRWAIDKTAATATARTAGGDPAEVEYDVTVTHDSGSVSNVRVVGEIGVTNPNASPVTIDGASVILRDGIGAGDFSCFVADDGQLTIPANDSTTFTYRCALAALPKTALTAVAEVAWSGQTLASGAELSAGTRAVTAAIDFTADVVTDECVTVTDPGAPGTTLGTACVGGPNPTVYAYTGTVSGPAGTCTANRDTATATTNDTGTTVSDEVTVDDCQGAELTAATTSDPSYTRTYEWKVTKNVDRTLVEQQSGTATFTYDVTAGQTGATDSAWRVTGTVTVHNPNDWEAVTVTGVSVASAGGTCDVEAGATPRQIAASGSTTVAYACTYPANPGSGLVDATVSWDAAAASTKTGSAGAEAPFTFGAPTTRVNESIAVTDTFNGTLGTLGSLTASDATPTTAAYHYTRTIAVPTWNCVKVDNTAKITQTGQSAGQTVEVCGPAKTGALTIGYWQNKNNGQAVIKNSALAGGVCRAGTWLRGFAPFGDLSTTGDCVAVAAYVTTTLSAASASGSSMNAMLKGQMLATALDVYFSDPSLGGNALKAPAPLGGVRIDLTRICTDLTCTAYEDSSPAFGGAGRLTILEILAAAASQSSGNGATWYGQVKATQELAKDVFDALNNLKVFAP